MHLGSQWLTVANQSVIDDFRNNTVVCFYLEMIIFKVRFYYLENNLEFKGY